VQFTCHYMDSAVYMPLHGQCSLHATTWTVIIYKELCCWWVFTYRWPCTNEHTYYICMFKTNE